MSIYVHGVLQAKTRAVLFLSTFVIGCHVAFTFATTGVLEALLTTAHANDSFPLIYE